MPRETSIWRFRWVTEFWKIILTFLPWQIYSKVKYEKRLLKVVKIQQLCIRSSVHNQLVIDNGKKRFNRSSLLVSFGTQCRFSGCFLANEISHMICFQLVFLLEIFDCTIYNQLLLNHSAIIFNSGRTSISRNISQWRLMMFYIFSWYVRIRLCGAFCNL